MLLLTVRQRAARDDEGQFVRLEALRTQPINYVDVDPFVRQIGEVSITADARGQ